MLKHIIRQKPTLAAVVIFLIAFGLLHFMQPKFLYKNDGSLREFGIGTKQRTILPIWLISLILGILSYLFICNIVNPVITF